MTASALIAAAHELSATVDGMRFAAPVTHVYNPLDYAGEIHDNYLRRYGEGRKRVVFIGMNPGPFGMAQIGVPFGEIGTARDWLGLEGPVGQPSQSNPKRPVDGFACKPSEVSGQRLWGLFRAFFEDGRNLTPDKLPAHEQRPLLSACDAHLRRLVDTLEPEWVIGIGVWAEQRALGALGDVAGLRFGRILHPSPASPAANRGWSEAASKQLIDLGIW